MSMRIFILMLVVPQMWADEEVASTGKIE